MAEWQHQALKEGPEVGSKGIHRAQAGEFPTERNLLRIKQEPKEEPQQWWDSQGQEFQKEAEPPFYTRDFSVQPELTVDTKDFQACLKTAVDAGQPVTHSPSGVCEAHENAALPVKVKQEPLDEDQAGLQRWRHRYFSQFCYQGADRPQETSGTLKSPKLEEDDPLEIVKLQLPVEVKQESGWTVCSLGNGCTFQSLPKIHKGDFFCLGILGISTSRGNSPSWSLYNLFLNNLSLFDGVASLVDSGGAVAFGQGLPAILISKLGQSVLDGTPFRWIHRTRKEECFFMAPSQTGERCQVRRIKAEVTGSQILDEHQEKIPDC